MAKLSVKAVGEAENNVVCSGWERTSSIQIKVHILTSDTSQTFPVKFTGGEGTYLNSNELPPASRQ